MFFFVFLNECRSNAFPGPLFNLAVGLGISITFWTATVRSLPSFFSHSLPTSPSHSVSHSLNLFIYFFHRQHYPTPYPVEFSYPIAIAIAFLICNLMITFFFVWYQGYHSRMMEGDFFHPNHSILDFLFPSSTRSS